MLIFGQRTMRWAMKIDEIKAFKSKDLVFAQSVRGKTKNPPEMSLL